MGRTTVRPGKRSCRTVEGVGKKWSMQALHLGDMGKTFGDITNLMKATSGGRKDPCPQLFTHGSAKFGGATRATTWRGSPAGLSRNVSWIG